jgi:hypothetical protein
MAAGCATAARQGMPTGSQVSRSAIALSDLLVDASRLRAVVNETLLEPWMFQRLFGRDSSGRVIDEYLAQEVEELPVEGRCGRDEVLKKMPRLVIGSNMKRILGFT